MLAAVAAATLVLPACSGADPATSGSTGNPSRPSPAATGADGRDAVAPATLTDPAVALQTVAEGLTSPVAMAEAPDGSGRMFVVDQIGLVRVITADGELLDDPFLDIRDQVVPLNESYDERGLLGLAFHPAYAGNGRFFVYYSAPLRPGAPQVWNNTSHLSEYQVTSDPLLADPVVGTSADADRRAAGQPCRRDGGVRARRLPLPLARRRWRRR